MFKYHPAMITLIEEIRPVQLMTWMGAFNLGMPKGTYILTTLPKRSHKYLVRPKKDVKPKSEVEHDPAWTVTRTARI